MTALMFAAATDATECIKKLIPAEAGMRDARGLLPSCMQQAMEGWRLSASFWNMKVGYWPMMESPRSF